ncbi:MAG: SPASM domain-containing protein [Bdellovibrionota bacterium]
MSKLFKSSKEVENYHKNLGYSDKFCIAPFTTLLLEPDGKVGACRHKGCEFPVGNILENSFDEIWNGAFIKNWRQEFLDGKPKVCATEVKDRKCHHCPEYSALIKNASIELHQTLKPLRLAFNFNGHCNLECQMCHVWQKPNGLYDQIGFWDKLDSWIENIEEVELLSGEPFVQKDTYKLIDLISIKKPLAKWTITTNANWKLTDYIKNQLSKISIKNIIISLDSLNEKTYSHIRKKGDLKKALAALDALQEYDQWRARNGLGGLNIKINFLFQQDNWQELGDVYNFSKKQPVDVFRTFLYEPEQYSLLSCSEDKRIEILEWYFLNLSADQLLHSMRVIRPLLDSLSSLNKFYFYEKYHGMIKQNNRLDLESP